MACGVVLSVTGLALPTESASADTPGCVVKREYKRVHKGMVKKRVHRIFDTRGRFGDGGAGGYSRFYRICSSPGWRVIVEYNAMHRRHRVSSKWTQRARAQTSPVRRHCLPPLRAYRKAHNGLTRRQVARAVRNSGHPAPNWRKVSFPPDSVPRHVKVRSYRLCNVANQKRDRLFVAYKHRRSVMRWLNFG